MEETKIVIPEFTKTSTNSNSDKSVCPMCHGSGWVTYRPAKELFGNLYGGEDYANDYAKRCPNCKGINISEDTTGVPDNCRECDIYKFKFDLYQADTSSLKQLCFSFATEFETWRLNNKGLYLHSKTPGSGKTFLACCMAKSAMMANGLRMKFITVSEYINLVGESYKRERGEQDPSKIYRECDLLIFDDIGTQMSKEFQQQELFRLIDGRTSKGLITIYTSNFTVSKLNVDERVKSRIMANSVVINMPEEPIRNNIYSENQAAFINKILA